MIKILNQREHIYALTKYFYYLMRFLEFKYRTEFSKDRHTLPVSCLMLTIPWAAEDWLDVSMVCVCVCTVHKHQWEAIRETDSCVRTVIWGVDLWLRIPKGWSHTSSTLLPRASGRSNQQEMCLWSALVSSRAHSSKSEWEKCHSPRTWQGTKLVIAKR